MAPIKYNSADHPLFNLQRVPRVLEDIEETRLMMAMMRGLYLKPQDQSRLDYRFYPWLRGWINPKKARCCRCFRKFSLIFFSSHLFLVIADIQ